jgi:predicted P-loop ATPase
VELALCRFALINIDEFDAVGASRQSFLKHVLTKSSVQTRRPYGSATERLRRYATFIATDNNFDLLTDPTGSRRFICIEVLGVIDDSISLNYRQLYAQAMDELRHGARYWFDAADERYITTSNRRFQAVSPEEELILAHFRVPTNDEPFEELTCTEMLERVNKQCKGNFRYSRSAVTKLGRSLQGKFEMKHRTKGNVYKVYNL